MPITTDEAAKLFGIGKRRIQKLINERRIPGARKIGRYWFLPDDFKVLPTAERRSNHPAMRITIDEDAEPPAPIEPKDD